MHKYASEPSLEKGRACRGAHYVRCSRMEEASAERWRQRSSAALKLPRHLAQKGRADLRPGELKILGRRPRLASHFYSEYTDSPPHRASSDPICNTTPHSSTPLLPLVFVLNKVCGPALIAQRNIFALASLRRCVALFRGRRRRRPYFFSAHESLPLIPRAIDLDIRAYSLL